MEESTDVPMSSVLDMADDGTAPPSPGADSSESAGSGPQKGSSLAAIAWRIRHIVVIITVQYTIGTMFLTTMPDLTASYFANKDYHGATLDCSHKYPEHSPQEKACTHGNGIGATYGGYSSAAQSACTFLFSPMIGVLADRHGRKLFIVLAQAFAAVPIVFLMLFVLNPTHGLFLFLYYVTNGVSGVFNTMALAMAYVADVSPIQLDRGPGFAFVLASFGLAIMIGPSIGGFVPPKLAAYLAVAFAGGVLLYAGFVVPETLKKTLAQHMRVTKLPWNPFQPLTILFANDLFMWLTIAVVSSTIGEYGQLSLLFYYTSGPLGFSRQLTSVLVVLTGIVGFITQGVLMKPAVLKFGAFSVLRFGYLTGFLNVMIWGAASMCSATIGRGLVFFTATVMAPCSLVAFPAVSAIKSNNVDDEHQGHVQGALYGARALAQMVSQLGAPQLYKATPNQPEVPMFVSACFLLFAFFLIHKLPPTEKSGACKTLPMLSPQHKPATGQGKPLLDDSDGDSDSDRDRGRDGSGDEVHTRLQF